MFWAIRQLCAPLRYLKIRHGSGLFRSKKVYDWVFPSLISAATIAVVLTFAPHTRIFSERGLLAPFEKLLEILIPFYIVALAAIATFAGEKLDEPMKGDSATLIMWRADGTHIERVLSRRQFVCYLFGYLSAVSLFMYVLILLVDLVADDAGRYFAAALGRGFQYARIVVMAIFLLPIWQMIVATLLGVYFMSDRLQVMDEPEI